MEKENLYWDLNSLFVSNKVIETFIRDVINKGDKTVINLHKHSCMQKRFPKLEIGAEYYLDVSTNFLNPLYYKKCKITYIRGNIVFYMEEHKDVENHFEKFSMIHLFAEPLEVTVNLDSDYYQVITQQGLTKINYIGKVK